MGELVEDFAEGAVADVVDDCGFAGEVVVGGDVANRALVVGQGTVDRLLEIFAGEDFVGAGD